MTEPEEQALLREYIDVCAHLRRGFDDVLERAMPLMPMTAERIDALSIPEEDIVFTFLKRFEQFEDALNRILKYISRMMEHGRIERLTSRDVTRRAYALGILDDEKVWAGAVRARNALVHDYPLNPGKRTDQLNTAWAQAETLTRTHDAILRFIDMEGLLE